jgi:hypothetical protein
VGLRHDPEPPTSETCPLPLRAFAALAGLAGLTVAAYVCAGRSQASSETSTEHEPSTTTSPAARHASA